MPTSAELFARILSSEQKGAVLIVIGVDAGEGASGMHVVQQLQWHPPSQGTLVLVQSRAPFSATPIAPGWESLASLQELESRFTNHVRLVLRESHDSLAASTAATGATVFGEGEAAKAILDTLRRLEVGSGKDWQLREGARPNETVVTTSAKNPQTEQRPAVRQLEQRVAAVTLMRHLGLTDEVTPHQVFPDVREERLRVAVYDDEGSVSSSGHSPEWLRAQLAGCADLLVELVGSYEVSKGVLVAADVLVVGGGYSKAQSQRLGESGRKAVQEFVRQGGGYVGICAGAFLASQPRGSLPFLGLLPVRTEGTSGKCVVPLKWAHSPLGSARLEPAKFSNGPRMKLEADAESVRIWARFEENPVVNGRSLTLKGMPAVVSGSFGKGRVALFSPHCERHPSSPTIFPQAVRWAGGPRRTLTFQGSDHGAMLPAAVKFRGDRLQTGRSQEPMCFIESNRDCRCFHTGREFSHLWPLRQPGLSGADTGSMKPCL